MPKKQTELTAERLKALVIAGLKEKGLTVAQFLESDYAGNLKIDKRSLSCYLSPTGSMSYPVFREICSVLNLGKLKRVIKVTKIVSYQLD